MTMTYDTFPAQTFDQFVTNFLNVLQTSTPSIDDASEGSVALAFAEATGGNDLAIQSLTYHVYNMARLTTSSGVDVDSFVADFGLTRAPAAYASTNTVVLSRNLTSSTLSVPVGAIVQTQIGAIQFALIADDAQPDFNVGENAYVFPVGVSTMTVTVQAVIAGSAGNVLSNTITQIVSGITGVSTVNNTAATSGGADQETDAALKLRFQLYIQSLAKATLDAVEAAIESVQAGLTYTVTELQHFDGTPWVGGFTVVVDDGSGDAPGSVLTAVYNAVNAVRAAGISFAVDRPTDIPINVTVTCTTAPGFSDGQMESAVAGAIEAYILGLGVGVTVSFVQMANTIQNTQINGTNCVYAYSNLLINTGNVDIVLTPMQLARPGSIAVTPTS